MECYIKDTVAGMLQLWNQLEDRRGEDDKMSRWVWKVVKDKVDKARIAKTKGERTKEIEEKQEEEVDLIKIRMVEEIVSRRFYKYLKVFEKESERMLMRKTWDHAIDLREGFVPKKRCCSNHLL